MPRPIKAVNAFILAEQLVEAIPVLGFHILHIDVSKRAVAFP